MPPRVAASRGFDRAGLWRASKGRATRAGGGPERVDLVAFDQHVGLGRRQPVGAAPSAVSAVVGDGDLAKAKELEAVRFVPGALQLVEL
jgi:hypothetical protein